MDLETQLRAARDGDSRAWKALVPHLFQRLRGFFGRDFDHADALDLTQTTLTVLVESLSSADIHNSIEGWVFGVAHKQALLYHRSRSRAQNQEQGRWELADRLVRALGSGLSTRVRNNDLLEVIREEIENLPPAYRRTIENDLADGDIELFAAQEGIERDSVRSRRFRGYKVLRRRLEARGVLPPVPPVPKQIPTPSPPT